MGNLPMFKKTKAMKELGPYTKLSGLYKDCCWSEKMIKKMIFERTIAPIHKGENNKKKGLVECPICFLYYVNGINYTKCCSQTICTECLLQVHPPKMTVHCPFCNAEQLATYFHCENGIPQLQLMISSTDEEDEGGDSDYVKQYASIEDRQKIEAEVGAQASSGRAGEEAKLNDMLTRFAHPEDLEQFMLFEALRRSLQDTGVQDPDTYSS